MIFEGTGKVIEDTGTKPIGPGDLVLIPAGEWHQREVRDHDVVDPSGSEIASGCRRKRRRSA
jgi:gentisate 1,2-dioxygenase